MASRKAASEIFKSQFNTLYRKAALLCQFFSCLWLAMIVSLMKNRSLMILDEWAADQDPKFRKYFYECILPELNAQGITLIVISHDDRYFHVADRVVVVDGGEICCE